MPKYKCNDCSSVFDGSQFSNTDWNVNPLLDLGPWSSPQDAGAGPQQSVFPNTMWDPATDGNPDEQPYSNVAASLKKEALQQQDVVDFYLLSLLPPEYLNKEVSPDHYDALAIFKGIIESLRNEYIERGMHELKDEAETTAWTKAIPEEDMPEQIKKYYTFHDSPFPGSRGDSEDDDSDYDSEPEYDYKCSNCGMGLNEYDVHHFKHDHYCDDCEYKAIRQAIREEVAFCETHKVFVTDNRDLKEHLPEYKFDSWENHHENGVCQVVRFKEGEQALKEMEENAKNQLELFKRERKEQREQKPKQMKLPAAGELCPECGTYPCKHNQSSGYPPPVQASLKQAGEGRYLGNDSGWWEAPTDFSNYTSQDFYTIFNYAPWKRMYGGPLWAEIAKTINQMQNTTDWKKLVVLIDHYHDLGHNSGKLLDKFPEWHKWFKNLLDQKAKKNSLRYLLPRASKPVQNLVTDFLKVHGRDWRADEGGAKEPQHRYDVGETVLFEGKPAIVVQPGNPAKPFSYFIKLQDGSSRWAWEDNIQDMPGVTSSLNRPFSKKAHCGPCTPLKMEAIKRFSDFKDKHPKLDLDQVLASLASTSPEKDISNFLKTFEEGIKIIEDVPELSKSDELRDLVQVLTTLSETQEHLEDGTFKVAFIKKANPDTRYWIAPDGKEFPVAGIHPLWIGKNPKILKSYGINSAGKTIYDVHSEMINSGWVRISNEPAGSGFQIEVQNIGKIPPFVDAFIAKHFTEGDIILVGSASQGGTEITDPFPNIQKAVNSKLGWSKAASLKEAAVSGQITNKILQSIHDNGGVTYNLTQGDMAGTPNYAVSIYSDRERIVDGVDFDVLEGFIDANEDLLKDSNNSLGAWTHEGKVYLGISVTISDRMKAVELAKQNNQIAIWDLQNNKEISVGSVGKVAYQAKRLWVDPNGKQYDVSKSWSHADWILDNKEMLKNDYGTDIGYKYKRGQDDRVQDWEAANAELISMGWSRVGDVRGETAYGIQVADIMAIPNYIVDILTEGGSLNGTIIFEDNNGKWVKVGLEDLVNEGQNAITRALQTSRLVPAFSKKYLNKKAEESLLPERDQDAIAAASSPAYVIAVNNYAEAFKRGHSKDRSLEYAIESVQNLEKVDPKKLVEFINTYIPN